jgi:hypothetical protein
VLYIAGVQQDEHLACFQMAGTSLVIDEKTFEKFLWQTPLQYKK